MTLNDIAVVPKLESFNLECKSRLSRDKVEGWLKTIAGFSNCSGGSFFVGVEDKTHKLIGFSQTDADNERNFFNNQVNEHLFPRPAIKISFLSYENNGKELFIIRIDVAESNLKPVIVKFKNVPSIYMRRDGFTNGATYEEIIEMSLRSQKAQFDVQDTEEPYNREDFSKLHAFFKLHNPEGELTNKALLSLGFFTKDNMLKNGAFLFSDKYNGSKTEVQCSVFAGFNKGSDRVVTINRFNGNLTDSIAFMQEFANQRMNHSFVKLDDSRENIDAYPERALFEGIINSIAHRDYYLDGTQIQLDMFKDRLEITSPGSFYQGEKFGKTYDLSNVISKRRNELICAVLVKCNVMEAAGTGFDKIMQAYADADEAHKPYIISKSDHFTLVLPDLTFAGGVQDGSLVAIDYFPPKNASEHDEKILSFCYEKSRKAGEIAAFLGLADSSYFRKTILENLVAQEYLVKNKKSGIAYYYTNRDKVKRD